MSTKLRQDWLVEDPLGAAHWTIARLALLGGAESQLYASLCSALDGALLHGDYPELEQLLAELATDKLTDKNTTTARRAAAKLGWQHRGRESRGGGWLEQWEVLLATLTHCGIPSGSPAQRTAA